MPTYTEHDFFEDVAEQGYKYGFVTAVESEKAPKGLSEETIRFISEKKGEPEWLLAFRLKALRHFFKLLEERGMPDWAHLRVPDLDFQDAYYYAAPGKKAKYESLDEVPPEILADFERLGIPLGEQARLAGVAVDAVMDSVSVATTFKEELARHGIIFCSFSEAVEHHPDLVRQYMGSVVPYTDNLFAALNSAVFSDGSFCYVPPGVRCPMELSTYFRINEANTGQFERTLVIADEGAYVSYMEGCLPAGEQVLTPSSWANIESLRPGDRVFDHNGKPQRVRAAMTRHFRGEMLTIRPVSRHNAFRLTPEHPVLAIRREDVLVRRKPRNGWLPEVDSKKLRQTEADWIPAGELKEGDFVLIPKLAPEEQAAFSDAQVELLGYYLAEGSATYNRANNQHTNQFSFGLGETDLVARARALVEEVTGRPTYLVERPERNGTDVTFYSEEHHDWFIRHCGKGAATKSLSPELMALPERQARIFLDAYLAGDGNVHDRAGSRMVRFCTTSETVARQVQMLLNRLGRHAWVQVREGSEARFSNGSTRTIHRQPLYQVGYTEDKKWDAIRETDTHFIVPIREITREPFDDLVFNVEVEETNSYLARGVAVHNCTAPMREEHQLHAAIVELVAHERAEIKYSTVQNWYPGDEQGRGGIYNFVTKRGLCEGAHSKITWTQLETGSAITWKYPSCILKGDHSVGEFYSVAFTKDYQQADTGTKMIHLGKHTRSTIISKGISAGRSNNAYRGLVRVNRKAEHARNFSQCDSLLLGDKCGAHTFPYIEIHNSSAKVEHEATTSKVGEDQLFYCQARGISEQDALNLIVNGYAKEILAKLPMEFAVEAQKLLSVQLEGSVG